ncbi:MAG: diguanylate cyclase domain-containing protein [Candidatus Merdivicinus sp.]|jgi:diguanylate cyclase (GGDEF)-like protein
MKSSSQPMKILIVDDAEVNRAILQELFCYEFDTEEAENGQDAIRVIERDHAQIAAILLDVVMPVMDGFGVLHYLSKKNYLEKIPVFFITAETSSDVTMQGYENGVVDVITKPIVDPAIVRKRVKNAIELFQNRNNLASLVEQQVQTIKSQSEKLKYTNVSIIDMLSSVIEFRSGESGQHVRRIRKTTRILLAAMSEKYPQYRMDEETIEMISNASAMHDVGKISIPDYILNKPGRLTAEEFEEMKKHPLYGCNLFEKIPFFQDESIFQYCYEICRHHHERWDGKGYPDRLKKDEIPIYSQVVAVADVYDALVSERVYKKAIPHDKALSMILNGEWGAFNPLLLEEFQKQEPLLYSLLYSDNEITAHEREAHIEWAAKVKRPAEQQVLSDRTLELLERERRRYSILSKMSGDILFDYDKKTDTLEYTEKYQEIFNGNIQIVHAADYFANTDQIDRQDFLRIKKAIRSLTPQNPIYRTEVQLRTKSGQKEWFEAYIQAAWDSENSQDFIGCIGKLTSIHQLKAESLHWKQQAMHDYLTGLYNRQAFEGIVHKMLLTEPDTPFSLMFIDIDNFKQVNDTKGHLMGDQLLKQAAKTLSALLRSTDVVARIGGDEFAVLLSGLGDRKVLQKKADAICAAFSKEMDPVYQSGISSSIGITIYPDDGSDYRLLLQKADTALYYVKNRGKGVSAFYQESMGQISEHTSLSDVDQTCLEEETDNENR